MTISNLSEAQQAADALAGFWAKFSAMIGPPVAGVSPHSPSNSGPAKLEPAFTSYQKKASTSPEPPELSEMQTRVLAILNASGKPLSLKQIEKGYVDMGFPGPPSGNIYTTVSSCAFNMRKRGYVVKTADGYVAARQNGGSE